MWIVKVALQRPYTFVVLAILLALLGPLTILRTPTDVFPDIKIPVVSVVWQYSGMPADEMGTRIIGNFERACTTTVNDIEHIESTSLAGVGVVKLFFQPTVNVELALAQVTAISQSQLKNLPPGVTSPLILSYSASSVPVLQLAYSSVVLSEQEMFDLSQNVVRTQLADVQGASIPYPYGGKQRQIEVDLDPSKLRAYGLSATDVNAAIGSQNLIVPAGTQKIGGFEYNVKLNASPTSVGDLNDLPIKRAANGSVLYVRDVAHVRDGNPPQTNIVRVNGGRAVLSTIQKTGAASTLDIIERIKERVPRIQMALPESLKIDTIGDQSLFVRGAISGVINEAMIAAALTGMMILLFLGSWRSTLIITISIPLSILASIIALAAIGQTINIMTLGGLALAVGILVDDATVTIENINAHLERGAEVEDAILIGADQIAIPALVSTLSICIVFIPMFLLTGVARYLFVPLAEAVVFAMLASYVLSRTLVPTLAKFWLQKHVLHVQDGTRKRWPARFQAGFERNFESLRADYRDLLQWSLARRATFVPVFAGLIVISFALVPFLGEDFFPSVDSGQIKLHVRAHAGTRVEETARLGDRVEDAIREIIPPAEIQTMVDNIGLPISGINLSYSNSGTTGPSDADILITLTPDHHATDDYVRKMRDELPRRFPGASFSFQPADIVAQILNFGLPAPIDVAIAGRNLTQNRAYADKLLEKMRLVPGLVDLHLHQSFDYPELRVNVDRTRAQELGLTQRDVATDMLISLSGSFQTSPTFWLSPENGVSYQIVTQTPQTTLSSLQALQATPIGGGTALAASRAAGGNGMPQILAAVGTTQRGAGLGIVSHYNTAPMLNLYAAVQDRDLGAVAKDLQRILDETASELPRGATVDIRGQVQTMTQSFRGLYVGLCFAILLVYLLIVVNFQSWIDPLIIITALPAALAGIVWMLFVTNTHLSVPALTGAIMCMGVGTANSILVISFARDCVRDGMGIEAAALEAGFGRFRPVLMTALAMIIGMIPMALGLGDGGEQNAPLGRAVIGGLVFATVATLLLVPNVFCLVHGRRRPPAAESLVTA
ncbi:efflux RND transporter permease subunit [Roseiterribacter gracilis]|uniref:RND transporter n=1 Tax=Roseiterribacter gracilis TaxID=2812848 RepID=A0A8S8X9Z3_9PROT|nr:RND transporter [Rhodospirillales bacterium TMPK1]